MSGAEHALNVIYLRPKINGSFPATAGLPLLF